MNESDVIFTGCIDEARKGALFGEMELTLALASSKQLELINNEKFYTYCILYFWDGQLVSPS